MRLRIASFGAPPHGEAKFLVPFAGKGAQDVNGKLYLFELDENTLYELDHRDEAVTPNNIEVTKGSRDAPFGAPSLRRWLWC
jgi:hypothetical protein